MGQAISRRSKALKGKYSGHFRQKRRDFLFFSFSSCFQILDVIHGGHAADVAEAAVTSHMSARWGECHPSRQLTSRGVARMTAGQRLAQGVRNVTKGAL